MAKIFTVNDLLTFCKDEISRGNGNKKIYISQDDEGNGFHPMFYAFTSTKENVEAYGYNPDEIILLG